MSIRTRRRNRQAATTQAVFELTEAIRLTVEYVGNDMLPPIEGWSWFDALTRYDPESAQRFADNPIRFPYTEDRT